MSNFSDETYLPLFRQIRKHWLWNDKPFTKGQAWIDLLLRAHHSEKPYELPVGNEIVILNQGELFSSDLRLADDWGWSRKKVLGFIELLRKEEMLAKKGTTKGTTYFIANYADWKTKVHQMGQRGDSEGTTKGHKQECKNGKNEKNVINDKSEKKEKVIKKKSAFIPDDYKLTEEHIRIALESGYPENKISDEFEYFHDYWLNRLDTKAKKVNWLKTWQLWVKRSVEKLQPKGSGKTIAQKNIENANEWLQEKLAQQEQEKKDA